MVPFDITMKRCKPRTVCRVDEHRYPRQKGSVYHDLPDKTQSHSALIIKKEILVGKLGFSVKNLKVLLK